MEASEVATAGHCVDPDLAAQKLGRVSNNDDALLTDAAGRSVVTTATATATG